MVCSQQSRLRVMRMPGGRAQAWAGKQRFDLLRGRELPGAEHRAVVIGYGGTVVPFAYCAQPL